jgi:bifunctional DNA-binding transcriptional regulator/antitoxin component of YhaV-PrlF toxin-antitoxin module
MDPLQRGSTVTTEGETTLPSDVRSALGLESGDRVRYLILGGEVRLVRARSVNDLRGLLARPGQAPVSLAEMDDAIAEGAAASGTDER